MSYILKFTCFIDFAKKHVSILNKWLYIIDKLKDNFCGENYDTKRSVF